MKYNTNVAIPNITKNLYPSEWILGKTLSIIIIHYFDNLPYYTIGNHFSSNHGARFNSLAYGNCDCRMYFSPKPLLTDTKINTNQEESNLNDNGLISQESFINSGGENFEMVPCLNDNDDHIALFKHLILKNT